MYVSVRHKMLLCQETINPFPTLSGLLRVWEALSLKLNWLVTFGSLLSVFEATLSGLSSSPVSSASPPSSIDVACQGSIVVQITLLIFDLSRKSQSKVPCCAFRLLLSNTNQYFYLSVYRCFWSLLIRFRCSVDSCSLWNH